MYRPPTNASNGGHGASDTTDNETHVNGTNPQQRQHAVIGQTLPHSIMPHSFARPATVHTFPPPPPPPQQPAGSSLLGISQPFSNLAVSSPPLVAQTQHTVYSSPFVPFRPPPPPPIHYTQTVPPPTFHAASAVHTPAPTYRNMNTPPFSVPPSFIPPPSTSSSSPPRKRIDSLQHIPQVPLFTRTIQSYPDLYQNTIPVYFPRKALELWKNHSKQPQQTAVAMLLPPPEDSRFLVQDDGNASPRLLTCNMTMIPQNAWVLQKTLGGTTSSTSRDGGGKETPVLGLICQPLAIPSVDYIVHDYSGSYDSTEGEGETRPDWSIFPDLETVPVISYMEDAASAFNSSWTSTITNIGHGNGMDNGNNIQPVTPLRCKFCQAYINPFCNVSHSTQKNTCTFTCNFCQTQTTVSLDTFLSSTSSVYKDIPQILPVSDSTRFGSSSTITGTTALQFGTVEYEVGGPFITRVLDSPDSLKKDSFSAAPPLVYLYALDVSSGMSTHIVDGYLNVLQNVAQEISSHWLKQQQQQQQYRSSSTPPRVGFILYDDSGQIYIPYWSLQKIRATGELKWDVQVALMLDVNKDPFAPLPLSEWTYYTTEYPQSSSNSNIINTTIQFHNSLNGLHEMLQRIPTILKEMSPKTWAGKRSNFNFTGAALAVLTHALECSTMDCLGGRITILTSSRPNAGLGALTDLEVSLSQHGGGGGGLSSTAKYAHVESERILYTSMLKLVEGKIPFTKTPTDDQAYSFYSKIIQQCQKYNISIDICMTTPRIMGRNFLGLGTLGDICQRTCGNIKWLKYNHVGDIQGSGWKNQLREELLRSALVYSGSDAIYKLRCSNGIHVKKFLPSNNLRVGTVVDTSELEFSRVNADTCIAIELDYDIGGISKVGGGKTNPIVYFQTALLYTTMTGRRRLRVSTLALPTTTSESEAFKAVRFGATCTLLTRKAIDDLFQPSDFGNLKRAGSLIMDHCVNILANYRHFTEAKHNTWDTLVLPETLGLLPLFCLGLRKSLMFRSSLSKDATQSSTPFPNADERAYRLLYGSQITPIMSMLTVHPNLFSLLDMKLGEGEWSPSFPPTQDTKILSHIVLPEPIPSSVCQLKGHGIYILDDGFTLYLFIGRDVSIEARADLLSYDSGEPQLQSSSELAKKIVQVINQIRRFSSMCGTQEQCARPVFPPLVLILGTGGSGFRKGIDDSLEKAMIECCVDDTSGGDSSYGDFLCEIHRRVKEKQKFLT